MIKAYKNTFASCKRSGNHKEYAEKLAEGSSVQAAKLASQFKEYDNFAKNSKWLMYLHRKIETYGQTSWGNCAVKSQKNSSANQQQVAPQQCLLNTNSQMVKEVPRSEELLVVPMTLRSHSLLHQKY
ncbi:unnamed protein product [Cylindrotheca closterium]|uniref:Uncharacterized protein n=1 Tax=Cylindrotheca closterium TaxID=2856 RepID=A0AAD2FPV1_9STRA|nr:unnamed protein product [Cylindrotheca closterium]